jgi:hypothetical protein
MEQIPSWNANRRSVSQEIRHRLWEVEGSLLCSQQQATDPYPEPDEFSLQLHTPFL